MMKGILKFKLIFLYLAESPRWMIANGRLAEAKVLIEKAAKVY
jgi:hypothetical protein